MNINVSYDAQNIGNHADSLPEINIYQFAKRFFDILLSVICILFLLPLCLLISMLIKFDSSGAVLFKQVRVGQNGKEFIIYKFRTMSENAPAAMATWKLSNADTYITRVGKFLRCTSLDELPQMINVLKGDMSFIGPRPLVLSEEEIHTLRLTRGVYRLKPGITGLAQISGRDYVNPEEKVRLDEEYLHSFSMRTDIRICVKTVFVVFGRKGFCDGDQKFDVN